MKKILENVTRITTQQEYELLKEYIEKLTGEATEKGLLSDSDSGNAYRKEIGRLAKIGAQYENEFMSFSFREPLILDVKMKMVKKNLRSKDAADLLGVSETYLSKFLNNRIKNIPLDFARKLHKRLDIDAKKILG